MVTTVVVIFAHIPITFVVAFFVMAVSISVTIVVCAEVAIVIGLTYYCTTTDVITKIFLNFPLIKCCHKFYQNQRIFVNPLNPFTSTEYSL